MTDQEVLELRFIDQEEDLQNLFSAMTDAEFIRKYREFDAAMEIAYAAH